MDDVRLAADDENGDTEVEHEEAHEEGSPEAAILLHEGSGNQGQRAQVDAPIEDHVDALVGDGGVNDDSLAVLLRSNGHGAALVLVGNQGGNVGLDTTGTRADDDDGDNVTRQTGSVSNGYGQRGRPQDNKTDPVDAAEEHDGLVLAEVLIRDDGTENRSHCTSRLISKRSPRYRGCKLIHTVAEPLEEQVQTSSGLATHTQTGRVGCDVLAIADVVLEKTRGTIVGETLRKLNNGDEEGRSRQVLAYTAQSPLLILIGLLAIRGDTGLSGLWRDAKVLLLIRVGGNEASSQVVRLAVVNTLVELLVEPS